MHGGASLYCTWKQFVVATVTALMPLLTVSVCVAAAEQAAWVENGPITLGTMFREVLEPPRRSRARGKTSRLPYQINAWSFLLVEALF
jgi:hypothetical protein